MVQPTVPQVEAPVPRVLGDVYCLSRPLARETTRENACTGCAEHLPNALALPLLAERGS